MPQVIIPCGKRKKDRPPTLAPTLIFDKRPVSFVAVPARGGHERAPWDPIEKNGTRTWIDCVADYNNAGALNPVDVAAGVKISGADGARLFCAGTLYTAPIYSHLIQTLGFHNVFILSAGWGLVRADIRLPLYNITFEGNDPVNHITPLRRQGFPKLFVQPRANPVQVFAGKAYNDFLTHFPHATFNIVKRVGKLRTGWYKTAAKNWLAAQGLPPVAPNGPCPCNCGFAIPDMHCNGQPFGGLVQVV